MNQHYPIHGSTARDLLKALESVFDVQPRVSDKPTRLYAKAGQLEVLEKARHLINQWENNNVLE